MKLPQLLFSSQLAQIIALQGLRSLAAGFPKHTSTGCDTNQCFACDMSTEKVSLNGSSPYLEHPGVTKAGLHPRYLVRGWGKGAANTNGQGHSIPGLATAKAAGFCPVSLSGRSDLLFARHCAMKHLLFVVLGVVERNGAHRSKTDMERLACL